MLITKGLDITVSQGDTARFIIDLGRFSLRASDTLRFSLKSWNANVAAASKSVTGLVGDRVSIMIPSSILRSYPPQTMVYDLTVINQQGVQTLNLPARFKIIGTAHEMDPLPPDPGDILIGTGGGQDEPPDITIVVPPDWGRMPDVDHLVADVKGTEEGLLVTKANGEETTIPLASGTGGTPEADAEDISNIFKGGQ